MTAKTTQEKEDRSRLIGVLACHLLTSPRTTWPGSDGLTVEDVVAADYRAESDAGHVPRCDELLKQHPELVEAIRYFFKS